MTGLQALDIGIGLIFIYLSLSLVCTAVNELFAGIMNWRAKNLAVGITNLLADSGQRTSKDKFFNHPLIQSLCRHKNNKQGPSYIPPTTFSLVLLDLLRTDENNNVSPLNEIQSAIETIGMESGLKKTLLLFLEETDGDLEKFRGKIEKWYDDVMNRVSGWYKRKLQLFTLSTAIVITVFTNADTIRIAKSLANDPSLRQALVTEAEVLIKEQQKDGSPKNTKEQGISQQLADAQNKLTKLGVPLGWNYEGSIFARAFNLLKNEPNKVFNKLIGWLITAFAVSLGAPFWFDMLNKIMHIRSSGPEDGKVKKDPKSSQAGG